MAENPLLSPTDTNIITPDEFFRQDRAPANYAINRLDENPDEAARSAEIGRATDTPPSIVHLDPEHFESQHKALLTQQLFEGNPHLGDYVAVHPFGADVSNDDWGQLDVISEHMTKFMGPLGLLTPSVVGAAAKTFGEAHGLAGDVSPEDQQKLDRLSTSPAIQRAFSLMFEQAVPGVQFSHEMNRMFSAGLQALSAAAEQWYINRTGDPVGAAKFGRDLAVFPQMLPEHVGEIPELAQAAKKVGRAMEVSKPWAEAGLAPPARIDPTVLQAAKTQARDDIKAFDELFSESQKSSTRGRDPESFRTFADLKFGDSTFGISADKILELYGDGVPEPGDNKLGWVPHIESQYQRALASGYDIEVPWKDFLAKATPEVYEALKEGIRVRHDGLTLDEAKETKAVKLDAFEEEYGQPYAMDREPAPSLIEGPGFRDAEDREVANDQDARQRKPSPTYKGALAKQEIDKLQNPQVGDFDYWRKIAEQEAPAHNVGGFPNPARAARNYSRTSGRPSIMINVGGERYGYLEGKKVAKDPGPAPIEPHESLAAAVGHGWESTGKGPKYGSGWDFGVEGEQRTIILPDYAGPMDMIGNKKKGRVGASKYTVYAEDILPQLNFDTLPEDAKALSRFWGNTLTQLARGIPIHFAERSEIQKIFHGIKSETFGGLHYNDQIFIPLDMLEHHPQQLNLVLLHEAAHAISTTAISKFPEIKATIRQMMDEVLAHHGEDVSSLSYGLQNEKEFIAEGVANPEFRRMLEDTPLSQELAEKLGLPGKTGSLWDAVRSIFKDLWEKLLGKRPDDSMMDAFFRMHEAIEEANKTLAGMAEEGPSAIELPPEEARRVFTNGRALGMNIKRLEAYLKLAKDQLDRDAKLKRDQAEMEAGARATKEWKDNYDRVRSEVQIDLLARPDIAADRFLRTGELPNGERLQKITLDPQAIDPELRSKIPEEFLSERGVAPDDLAPVFAFQSGDQLVRSIARLGDERKLQDLTPAGHLKGLIDREAQRQMMEKYGRSAQDIIDEAKEHVVGPTRLDILHAELQALAGDKPISEQAIKAQAKKIFDRVPVGTHASDKYIQAMGREGEKFETAMIEGNGAEAFQAKQKQVLLAHQLKLALKLEKDLKSFDTRAGRWARRDPPSLRPEDVVWIHDIMRKIGFENEIGLQDLERRKSIYSEHATLREYVDRENNAPKQAYNSDPDAPAIVDKMPVADFLFDENYRNTIPEMTPPEFRAVFDSLKTIDHFSREENKTDVRGRKKDVAEVVDGLVERLKAAVGGEPITRGEQKKSVARTVGSLLLNPETWFNRLDLGNRQGPFNQLIVRPLMEGQYQLRTLEKRFAAQWRELGQIKDYNKKIENPGLWLDPREGYQIEMHKGMAYAVLQNMGNELQRKKLLMGWGLAKTEAELPLAEQKVWSWLQSVGIDEKDLARAQKMGAIFGDAFAESEAAYSQLSGVAPARIDLYSVQTPWGEVPEWYHPLIPDPLRYRHTPDMNTLLEDGYHRPSPAAGYTKERTGALYPLDLSLYSPAFRLKQVLNDAAMRVPITNVAKVIYHPAFQEAFAKYYGKEYQSALDAWIKDLAGNRQWVPSNIASVNNVMTGIQNNLATLLIGWNLGTVLKHGPTAAVFSAAEVGPLRLAKYMFRLMHELPRGHETWTWVMNTSEEVANRMHSTQESMSATDKALFPTTKERYWNLRETIQRAGAVPVGVSDLISAVAMFAAEYERLEGLHPDMSHGDLVYAANTAVRRTHGSSLLASRTQAMRAGPMWRGMMPFYNFFSNALQRNYEGAVFAKDRWQGKELPEMVGFDKEVMEKDRLAASKVLMGSLLVYGIMPSIIESWAETLTGHEDKKESWAHWGARSLTQAFPAQFPVVRDLVNYLERGYDPSLGLYGTLAKEAKDAVSPKAWFKDPGTFLRKTNAISGLLTGMNYESVGRAGQFWLNVQAGSEHPKSPWEYWKGTMRGTLKERNR